MPFSYSSGNSIDVTRDQNKTVTKKENFALLVQADSPAKAAGEATFLLGLGFRVFVRAATLDELKRTARKMPRPDGEQFSALLALRAALEARDEFAIARAKERVEHARLKDSEYRWAAAALKEGKRRMEELERLIDPLLDFVPELRQITSESEQTPSRLLSAEVSRIVALRAHTVLWAVNGILQPGIYCTDLKAALYIHTFFIAPTWGPGFRSCPYDGEQFFQKQTNQEYCCPAHRDAHRVARFRENQKRKAGERERDRRKHGPNKAR